MSSEISKWPLRGKSVGSPPYRSVQTETFSKDLLLQIYVACYRYALLRPFGSIRVMTSQILHLRLKIASWHVSGEAAVLVNRGWVPATWQEERETEAISSAPAGSGRAARGEKQSEGQTGQVGFC